MKGLISSLVSLSLAGTAVASPVLRTKASTSSQTTGYSSGSTASDVENGVCAPLTVIFARGTGEFGNIGTIIGPPLFQALSSQLGGNVALQGVNYPADLVGDTNYGASGGPDLASLAAQALQQCPSTKLALSGYSQGAMVVHNSLNDQGEDSNSVTSIVYFGDPLHGIANSGTVPASDILDYCATGDGVCEEHTFLITPAHLSYGADATEAAQFIISKAGLA